MLQLSIGPIDVTSDLWDKWGLFFGPPCSVYVRVLCRGVHGPCHRWKNMQFRWQCISNTGNYTTYEIVKSKMHVYLNTKQLSWRQPKAIVIDWKTQNFWKTSKCHMFHGRGHLGIPLARVVLAVRILSKYRSFEVQRSIIFSGCYHFQVNISIETYIGMHQWRNHHL
jgi:hypothetical protein